MRRLLRVLLILSVSICTAQKNKIFFSETLDMHLPTYIQNAEDAIKNREQDKISLLFDNLVKNNLIGTYMDNFTSRNLGKKVIPFSEFEKPVILFTFSSWAIPSKGELPAINELAKEYKNELSIVLLFWGDHKTVRKKTKDYHNAITIHYVDDQDNKNTHIIHNLKHSLGLPLIYIMNSQKEIIAIEQRIANKLNQPIEEAYVENKELVKGGIIKLLDNERMISEAPIVSH